MMRKKEAMEVFGMYGGDRQVIAKFLIEKTFTLLHHHRRSRSHHHLEQKKSIPLFATTIASLRKKFNGNIDHYKVIMVLLPGFFFCFVFLPRKK